MFWLTIIMAIGIIYVFAFFIWVARTTNKSRAALLEKLAKLLNSQVENLDRMAETKKISFIYDGKGFEFIYNVSRVLPFGRFQHLVEEAFLKIKTQTSFTLKFFGKTGDSIGSVVDKVSSSLFAKGCHELNKQGLSNLFKDLRVYTNHDVSAKIFLSDTDVLRILSEYKNQTWLSKFFLMPFGIEDGIITLRFNPATSFSSQLLKPNIRDLYLKPDSIIEHVKNIIILSDKINTLR